MFGLDCAMRGQNLFVMLASRGSLIQIKAARTVDANIALRGCPYLQGEEQ
jgi:hypothetical protein